MLELHLRCLSSAALGFIGTTVRLLPVLPDRQRLIVMIGGQDRGLSELSIAALCTQTSAHAYE